MTHGAAPTSGASGLGAFACTARPGHLRLSRLVLSFLRGLGARREFSLMCFRIPHPTGDTHAGSGARTRGEAGPRVPPDSTQEARWDRLQTPSVVTPGVRPPPQPRSRRGKLAVRIADGCLASRLGGARVRPSRPRLCPGGRARLSQPRPPPGADRDGGGRFVEEAAGRRRTQGRDESRRGREASGRPLGGRGLAGSGPRGAGGTGETSVRRPFGAADGLALRRAFLASASGGSALWVRVPWGPHLPLTSSLPWMAPPGPGCDQISLVSPALALQLPPLRAKRACFCFTGAAGRGGKAGQPGPAQRPEAEGPVTQRLLSHEFGSSWKTPAFSRPEHSAVHAKLRWGRRARPPAWLGMTPWPPSGHGGPALRVPTCKVRGVVGLWASQSHPEGSCGGTRKALVRPSRLWPECRGCGAHSPPTCLAQLHGANLHFLGALATPRLKNRVTPRLPWAGGRGPGR